MLSKVMKQRVSECDRKGKRNLHWNQLVNCEVWLELSSDVWSLGGEPRCRQDQLVTV